MAAVKHGATNVERAHAAWPAGVPDWIDTLAKECDRSSQTRVAERIRISSAVVNQVLGNKYNKGRLDLMEQRVRGALMQQTVACPVLGALSSRDCLEHQVRKFRPTNALRVELYRACKSCPNRRNPT